MFSTMLAVLCLASPAHSSANSVQLLTGARTSVKGNTQRVVFDIARKSEPQFYTKKDKDVFNLTLEANVTPEKEKDIKKTLENTKYIKSVQFLNLPDEGEVIIMMFLKIKTFEDTLALPNPSRIVVDFSKNKLGD